MAFQVGDKVLCYGIIAGENNKTIPAKAVVTNIFNESLIGIETLKQKHHGVYRTAIHPKQCRRLVKKGKSYQKLMDSVKHKPHEPLVVRCRHCKEVMPENMLEHECETKKPRQWSIKREVVCHGPTLTQEEFEKVIKVVELKPGYRMISLEMLKNASDKHNIFGCLPSEAYEVFLLFCKELGFD